MSYPSNHKGAAVDLTFKSENELIAPVSNKSLALHGLVLGCSGANYIKLWSSGATVTPLTGKFNVKTSQLLQLQASDFSIPWITTLAGESLICELSGATACTAGGIVAYAEVSIV